MFLDCLKNDKKRIDTIIVATLVWGILAHGSILFNLYSFFDNSDLFNIGATFELGRWFLGIMSWATMYFSGSLLYTTPLFNGIITIICIGISSYLIADLLNIKRTILVIILNGLMIVFPAVTSALGYMFTAPYYYFALLLGLLGIYFFKKLSCIFTFVLAIILMACSAGTYQANMSLYVGLLLIITIDEVKNDKNFTNCSIINAGLCVGMLLVYLLMNSICLRITGIEMSTYKGTSDLIVGLGEYINRIIIAYKEFIMPTDNVSRNMFPFSLLKFYKLLLFASFIVLVFDVYKQLKCSISKGIKIIVLLLFIPLASNFIYLFCEIEFVYSIMMYGQLTLFILLIYELENIDINSSLIKKSLISICIVILSVFCVLYTKFDNDCYLKAEVLQTEIRGYLTTIVSQIKSLDGYYDGIKVCYMNDDNINDSSIPSVEQFDSIYIHPYHMDSLIHDYNLDKIMERQIGFAPEKIKQSEIESLEEVKSMPCYPNSGSIKIINDVVVVKFAD